MVRRIGALSLLLNGLVLLAAWGAEPQEPARLTLAGIEKVPDGPRKAYEAYLRAVAEGKVADALACLHDDFMGNEGGKVERKWRLETAWTDFRVEAMTVEVEHAEAAKAYTRPRSLRLPEKTWTGDLCVIVSRTATTLEHRGTKAKQIQKSLPTKTVLKKDDGKWLIVSEHVESQNLRAVLLASDLTAALKASLGKARLWDGEKELAALDAIRARLTKVPDGALLSWEPVGVVMAGELHDEPQIKGRVTVEAPGRNTGRAPVCYEVAVSMVMDKGRLRLVGIAATPTAHVPPEKGQEKEKEPEKKEPD